MSVVTQDIQNQVSELYITFFDRAPDAIGFGFWTQALANGATVSQIAADMSKEPEFVSQYGGLTPDQQIERFYENVLDREADPTGLAYWTNLLDQGVPFYDIAYSIVNTSFVGGPNVGDADTALVRNKVEIAEFFAIDLASNDGAIAATAFDGVTADPATVVAKEAELTAEVNAGTTYTLTTSVDTIDVTGNATINGVSTSTAQTFSALDTVKAGAGSTLNVVDGVTAANAAYALPLGATVAVTNLNMTTSGSFGNGLTASPVVMDLSKYSVENVSLTATGSLNSNVKVADTSALSLNVLSSATNSNTIVSGGTVVSVTNTAGTASTSVTGAALTDVTVTGGGAATVDNLGGTAGTTTATGKTLTSVTLANDADSAIKGAALETITLSGQGKARAEPLVRLP